MAFRTVQFFKNFSTLFGEVGQFAVDQIRAWNRSQRFQIGIYTNGVFFGDIEELDKLEAGTYSPFGGFTDTGYHAGRGRMTE